jgi:hypothetical protein
MAGVVYNLKDRSWKRWNRKKNIEKDVKSSFGEFQSMNIE